MDVRAAPIGSIEINDGRDFTSDRVVYINASLDDVYPVTQARLGEAADLFDSPWVAMRSSLPFQLSIGDGRKTVYVQFRNSQGEVSPVCSDDIYLDTSPPVGTVTVNDGAEFANDTRCSLSLSATDASSVTEMIVSNRADFQGAQWTAFKGRLDWNLLPGNGTRTVFAKFRDGFWHESTGVNDTIILDTSAPTLRLTITSGAPYTRVPRISLRLEVTENYRTESMVVSQYDSLDGLDWTPFQETVQYDLFGGDGTRTVRAKVRDAAGNEGAVASATTILDTVAPVFSIGEMPSETDFPAFPVNWSGTDFASGVASFDMQVRDGTGPWEDWYQKVNRTSALYSGKPGHSYSFRGRVRDRAGNEGVYTEGGSGPVYIWPKYDPVVTIASPRPRASVSGTITVSGTASQPDTRRTVGQVTLAVDDAAPVIVAGTTSWKYRLDTTRLSNGEHTLTVQARDGDRLSNETKLEFSVRNPDMSGSVLLPAGLAAVVAAVAVAALAFYIVRKRKAPAPAPASAPAPAAEMELKLSPEASLVTELSPEARAHIAAMITQPVEARERTEEEMRVAEQAARESRILTALSSLPRGLPPSLWGIEMEDMAAQIVNAERKDSPEGDLLVKLNNRWYFGDETDPGLFMQEYKDG